MKETGKKQLLIPSRIKVGFVHRSDTYTKKLAYVIYYDTKGVLRKQKSWADWIERGWIFDGSKPERKIQPLDFDNVPTEGFVLNKGVGGARQSHGWNARNEYIRVYDPRDFEFEISVANLLFILRETNCNKGKGLEGKFVYAWDGAELVLLPEGSEDYRSSQTYTKLQTSGVKTKELVLGWTYETKKQDLLVYLGKREVYINIRGMSWRQTQKKIFKEVKHIFWNQHKRNWVFLDSLSTLAAVRSDEPVENTAELVDAYYHSKYGSPVVDLRIEPRDKSITPGLYHSFWAPRAQGGFFQCNTYSPKSNPSIEVRCFLILKNGRLESESCYYKSTLKMGVQKEEGSTFHHPSWQNYPERLGYWIEPVSNVLIATLASGAEFITDNYDLFPLAEEDKIDSDDDDEETDDGN